MSFTDNSVRYGSVSRILHWGMAVLLLWQFSSIAARVWLADSAIDNFLWSTHRQVGFSLFVLIAIRLVWALSNVSKRPPSVSVLAKLGHIVLYVLMFSVPLVALLRQYGSGRVFEPFGIPVFSGFDDGRIDWMISLGSNFHSTLGWLMFILIAGHIVMAFVHRRSKKQPDVLPRMW